MSEPSRTPATGRPGKLIRAAVAVAIVVFAAWLLNRALGSEGWRSVGARLERASPLFLALAVAATLCGYTVWGVRWLLILRPVAPVPWWPAQKALMTSIFVNTVVPFARSLGGLVRAAALGRSRGIPVGSLYGPTLIDQIGYSAVSVSLGALSVPFALWGGGAGRGRTVVFSVVAAVVVICVVLVVRGRREDLLLWVRSRIPAAAQSVEQAVGAARIVMLRPATWSVIPIGGSAVWLCNVLTFLLAGRAVGAGFGLGGAAAAWSLGSIAGVASGTPGGIGTTETAAIVPLVAAGVPAAEALAAVLLARLIQYITAIVLGGACFLSETAKR